MEFNPFKITYILNGATPDKEYVYLQATAHVNTKGYALVDFTFDSEGYMTNNFRHIYVFPEIELEANEKVVLCSGEGTDRIQNFLGSDEEYMALFWNVEGCVWNDNGGDRATLIKFDVVNTAVVPAIIKN